jgi:hypothetical protein
MNDIGLFNTLRRNAIERQIIFILSTTICIAIYFFGL